MWEWIVSLGSWSWFILAALLFLIEVLSPGMFMLWLGLAAILVGVISSFVDWSWQPQLIAFAAFALASVPAWRHFARTVEKPPAPPERWCTTTASGAAAPLTSIVMVTACPGFGCSGDTVCVMVASGAGVPVSVPVPGAVASFAFSSARISRARGLSVVRSS